MNLKMKPYHGGDLKGIWLFTRKLDGVCVLLDCSAKTAMSKRGKPLHNFDDVFEIRPDLKGVFEVFRDDWNTSVSLVRNEKAGKMVELNDLRKLDVTEPGLRLWKLKDPKEAEIKRTLKMCLDQGEEGLVLVPCDADGEPKWEAKRIKVKDAITIDVRVTGMTEGKGKYKCMLGAFTTDYGNAAGFTDDDRYNLYHDDMIGEIIEVTFMEWTKAEKMRHPRYQRWRWDKCDENLEISRT